MATFTPLPPRRPMPPKVLPRCSLQEAIHLIESPVRTSAGCGEARNRPAYSYLSAGSHPGA